MIDRIVDFQSLISQRLDTYMGISVLVMDSKGYIAYTNKNFQALCKRKPFELLKSPILHLPLVYFDDESLETPLHKHRLFAQINEENTVISTKLTLKNEVEETFRIHLKRQPIPDIADTYYLFSFIEENTKVSDLPLEKMLDTLFIESNEAIVITDSEPRILTVNPAFERITGYTKEEAVGQNPSLLASGYHPRVFYEKFWQTLNSDGRWVGKIVNRRKSGEVYSEQITVWALHNALKQTTHYVSVFSELHKKNEHTHSKPDTDPTLIDKLTGLPGYSIFKDRLDQALGYARRHQLGTAVFSIDIDHFEQFNKDWGVQSGDKMMRSLAQAIQQRIREGDTLSRASGDEFILFVRDISSDFNLPDFSDRLLSAISQPVSIDINESQKEQCKITASIGISYYPEDQATAEQLIRHAGYAMSLAKAKGRNRYVFFSADYERKIAEKNMAKQELLTAIKNDELRLHVQPQYNAHANTIHGVELLIRWQKSDDELIYPDQFLNSLKDPDVLTKVDQWVIKKAIQLLADELRFIADRNLKVGINLTTFSLQDREFHKWLIKQLTAAGEHISQTIEIEILEHDALKNLETLRALINDLKPLGVTFSLDDFG
ncbi:MAG: diguanylate cyclase, partial [Thiomicrorhabdus sp.]|nr:diguanylate cyclase [Thiomicrorhabdus sp.]